MGLRRDLNGPTPKIRLNTIQHIVQKYSYKFQMSTKINQILLR